MLAQFVSLLPLQTCSASYSTFCCSKIKQLISGANLY